MAHVLLQVWQNFGEQLFLLLGRGSLKDFKTEYLPYSSQSFPLPYLPGECKIGFLIMHMFSIFFNNGY